MKTVPSVDGWAGSVDREPVASGRTAMELDGPEPGSQSIVALVDQARNRGLDITLTGSTALALLSPDSRRVALQVIRAGLVDAFTHAGSDGRVHLRLAWGPTELDLRVHTFSGHCSGRHGVDGGRALDGLERQVTAVRGRYSTGPTEAGFLTRAWLPICVPTNRSSSPAPPMALAG